MKVYSLDYGALLASGMAIALGYHMHDPLDTVLILADVMARPGFTMDRFCRWCVNWDDSKKRAEPRLNEKGEYKDGLWSDAYGKPVRRGSACPTDSCGNCVIGKLNERIVADPDPLTLEDKVKQAAAQVAAIKVELEDLYVNPIANSGRIKYLREKRDHAEQRMRAIEMAREVRSGKRLVRSQAFAPNPTYHAYSDPRAFIGTAPAVEHWEDVADWDDGKGNNLRAPLRRGEQVGDFSGRAPRQLRRRPEVTAQERKAS